MENFDGTHQVKPKVNDAVTRDPIVALEALMQIKDGSFGDRSHESVEESSPKSSHHLPSPLPLDITPNKTINASSALLSLIQTGESWPQTYSYSQPNTACQSLSKPPKYKGLFPTPNPLENQVCNIESSQFLQPIAPKANTERNVIVRTEEVEAALRSKPQRGKKRDNLNGMERLELTRTRNREHAKNTRIRKKARYEELVQNEAKYLELNKKQEVNNNLINNVMKFIDARTKYMNTNLGEQNSSIWHISSGGIQNDKSSIGCENKPRSGALLYDQILDDTSCFKFEVVPHPNKTTGDGLIDLQAHDADVVVQVKARVRKKVALSFNFLVKKDDIALSGRNSSFAEFTLQLISRMSGEDCQVICLCSGIIHFHFAQNSHKITSVKDIITYNCLSSLDTIFNRGNCSLGTGITFPSVVSLDHPCNLQNDNP